MGHGIDPPPHVLLARLERDIAWLDQRGLWNRSLYERAILRYVEARGSTEGLEDFTSRHRIRRGLTQQWIRNGRKVG